VEVLKGLQVVIYEFEDILTGDRALFPFPIGEAPQIGHVTTIKGRRYRRLLSCHIDTGVKRKTRGYPFVSRSLPKGCCPESQTEDGKPVIKNQLHEKEVLARTGYVRDDPGVMSQEIAKQEKRLKAKRR
jgi:hypothetical protein